MINRETVKEFFFDLRKDGNFDSTKPLLYGYFFTDSSQSKLLSAGKELERNGYKFVDIFESKSEDDNAEDFYYLHVEKIETHTIDSLDKRNNDFYLFAQQNKFASYDGFDVGNLE